MKADPSSVAARAKVHAALGEPVRLAIADLLAVGDASPGELGGRLGLPTNLLAHHLGVLADAGIIERRRSEHDRRRSYLRLRPAGLAILVTPALPVPRRVVFVCTRNSARSQLAAALWAAASPIPAASAGTDPAPRVHPRAMRTARRHGLRLDRTATRRLDQVTAAGDLVIAVCDHAHETLPPQQIRLHWSVLDPVPADTDEAFEAAYTELAERVERLVPALPAAADPAQETTR